MTRLALVLCALILTGPARADAPRVAADILPVHSLVAQVMEGVGTPDLVLPPGASPHGYALRPSQAGALQAADLVVWIGPEMTPWLGDALGPLAGDARILTLLDVEGAALLEFREAVAFDGHEEHAHESEHAHDDHADDGHGHDDHADDDHGHGHDHDGVDPHAWLDPENAKRWLGAIATALGEIDPENADTYRRNAAMGVAEIDTVSAEIDWMLTPVRGKPFIVFHDAYQYFERDFAIPSAGAISLGDAEPPGPARVQALRDLVADRGAVCVFAEPQFPADLVATVTEGTGTRSAVLDPLGGDIPAGPQHYAASLMALARGMADCLR